MGIKKLLSLCKSLNLERRVSLTDFSGHAVVVDGNDLAYTIKTKTLRNLLRTADVTVFVPESDEVMLAMYAEVVHFLASMARFDILCVFVFDGNSPEEKDATLLARGCRKQIANVAIEGSRGIAKGCGVSRDNLIKMFLANVRVSCRENTKLLEFITDLGMPALKAQREADSMVAGLVINKCVISRRVVKAALTRDTDVLVYGVPLMIVSINWQIANVISSCDVRRKLNLTHEQFVDMCIIAGCDYNIGVCNFNIQHAIRLMQRYKRIEDVPEIIIGEAQREALAMHHCRQIYFNVRAICVDTAIWRSHAVDGAICRQETVDANNKHRHRLLENFEIIRTQLIDTSNDSNSPLNHVPDITPRTKHILSTHTEAG
jgi:flap endonuclease-1